MNANFPGSASGKEPPLAMQVGVRDRSAIPGLGRSPGGGCGNPLSILAWRIPLDKGAWRATVHGVTWSWT